MYTNEIPSFILLPRYRFRYLTVVHHNNQQVFFYSFLRIPIKQFHAKPPTSSLSFYRPLSSEVIFFLFLPFLFFWLLMKPILTLRLRACKEIFEMWWCRAHLFWWKFHYFYAFRFSLLTLSFMSCLVLQTICNEHTTFRCSHTFLFDNED